MYDINVKNVKKGRRFFYLFLFLGIFFFIVMTVYSVSSIIKLKSFDSSVTSTNVEVKSYISDEGDIMYSPVYSYVVDGRDYVCTSGMSSTVNPGNSNKTVYYDSSNPSNCMTEYSKSGNTFLLFFTLLPILFIIVAVVNINKVNKRVKKILELNKTGKLVKNLPYRLENSGTIVNDVPLQMPVVDYVLPNGLNVTLCGDVRNERKTCDSDGMVDLVIDENNPDNYFIDFEINRIGGNLPQDYYQQNSSSSFENGNRGNQPVYNQNLYSNNYNQGNNNQNISNQDNNIL